MADVVPGVDSVPEVLAEVQAGHGLALSAAGRLFPGHRGGASVDPSTVFRWVTKGTRTPAGRVVKLEAVRVGGRWLTSRGSVARFVAALTAAADPPPPAPKQRTTASCSAASARAAAALEAAGA